MCVGHIIFYKFVFHVIVYWAGWEDPEFGIQ